MNNILLLFIFLVMVASCQISENAYSEADVLIDVDFFNLMVVTKKKHLYVVSGKSNNDKIDKAILIMEKNGDYNPCNFPKYISEFDDVVIEFFDNTCKFYKLYDDLSLKYGVLFSKNFAQLASKFEAKNPNFKVTSIDILKYKNKD